MRNDSEPKENNCKIRFYCPDSDIDCVHRKKSKHDWCMYLTYSTMSCNSKLAQVNALTIRLQELTGKKVVIK